MVNLRFKKYRCSYHWNMYSPKSNCKVRKTYAYSFHDIFIILLVSIINNSFNKICEKNNLEILITNTWKLTYNKCTGYDYPDLPVLGNNNEKLGLPERLSTGIQFRFRNLFHGKKIG